MLDRAYDWLFSEPVTRIVIVVSLTCAVALVIELMWQFVKLKL